MLFFSLCQASDEDEDDDDDEGAFDCLPLRLRANASLQDRCFVRVHNI